LARLRQPATLFAAERVTMAAPTRRALVLAGVLSLATLLSWAGMSLRAPAAPEPPTPSRPAAASHAATSPAGRSPTEVARPRPAAEQTGRALPEVHTLHRQEASAYHARLFAEGDRIVLVTPNGFTTLQHGRSETHALALGSVAAVHGDTLVFWRSGSLREVSLSGQDERSVVSVPQPPRYLLASESRLAWIHSGGATSTSVWTLSGGQARVIHRTAFGVSAPVLHAGGLYAVVLRDGGSWSIAHFDLDGEHVTSSEAHQGRPPAMLAVGHDGVYFYDGPQRGVRRLTFGLEREGSVSSGVVCSPLAVSSQVVCAQVGGLFAVSTSSPAPRFLAPERGPVTALAVTRDRVVWMAESGEDQLVVRGVALPAP
jgi:hypothetical protein